MKASIDYTLVVPNRKRAHNMEALRRLLPTATLCVDEREAAEYSAVVPEELLLLHPPLDGLPHVTNWLLDHLPTPIIIRLDDDFRGVVVTASGRRLTDPDEILAILENAARCCADLRLGAFCFSRTPNTSVIRPAERPIVPVQAVCSAFGVMNAARHRKLDPEVHGRADVDYTLQTLLEDRCVFADVRFYFDFGPIGYGTGGSSGMISKRGYENATRRLINRWGRAVGANHTGYGKSRKSSPLKIKVSRTNPRAQR